MSGIDKQKPDFFALGIEKAKQGDWEGALREFQTAKNNGASFPKLDRSLGLAMLKTCRYDQARMVFDAILKDYPNDTWTLTQLLRNSTYTAPNTPEIAKAQQLLRDLALPETEAIRLNLSLGKVFHQCGEYSTAFKYFAEGNKPVNRTSRFDPVRWTAYVDRLLAAFNPDVVEKTRGMGLDTELPVFIVGTPRAGKSIVEHLLASLPGLGKAGEVSYLPVNGVLELERELSKKPQYPESIENITTALAKKIASKYLQHLSPFNGPDVKRITDTIPSNLVHIGLIAILFPNAHVIFCDRNPDDAGLDIFFKHFAVGNDFSYQQEHIANYIWNSEKLMAHWLKLLPLQMHTVQYEDLASEPQETLRKLSEFLSLPLPNLGNNLNELSYCGKPINTREIGIASHYKDEFQPFRHALSKLETG